MRKAFVDIAAMALLAAAIITGFMLHNEVWHLHIYNNTLLWTLHEVAGLLLIALVTTHCAQHSFWFKNYAKIKPPRKTVTTILLLISLIVALSGIPLLLGSRSETLSHIHYVSGILFTLLAIGHVAKRWKLLRSQL